jgi:hypothetical protein
MSASIETPWVILTSRYGGDTRGPSAEELAHALAEIFHENLPSMTESDYAEHPNAWLRYGFDAGPMYVLDVYRGGCVHFSQWTDQDYEAELAPESVMNNVSEQAARHLWELLSSGDIGQLRSKEWNAI